MKQRGTLDEAMLQLSEVLLMRSILAALAVSISLLATTAANASTIACSTVTACVFAENMNAGSALEGFSKGNDGIVGATAQDATSSAGGKAGVAGYDKSTNRKAFNAGVSGTSAFGNGVRGTSTSGYGVLGTSTSSHAVQGISATSFGVVGVTNAVATSVGTARAGVLGESTSASIDYYNQYNAGVAGVAKGVATGVIGSSVSGTGVFGHVYSGFGVYGATDQAGVGGLFTESAVPNSDGYALEAYAGRGVALLATTNADGPAAVLETYDPKAYVLIGQGNGSSVLSIDSSGNEILSGSLTADGSPVYDTRTSAGTRVAAYGPRDSSPVLEDFGKAELRDGLAYIALDRTFASTIDVRSYMVFITPEGDSNGLFTQLSSGGFTVRESKRGHSSLTFDYRIVAKPLDTAAAHLPAMADFPQLPKHVPAPILQRH